MFNATSYVIFAFVIQMLLVFTMIDFLIVILLLYSDEAYVILTAIS